MIRLPSFTSNALLSYALRSDLLAPVATRARGWVLRQRGKALRRRKEAALSRHGSVSTAELAERLRSSGVRVGDTVFAQVSVKDMLTFSGTPLELLGMLRDLVGDEGTLLMPAYTAPNAGTPQTVVDLDGAPTYTGIVNEIFRRTPGVARSVHPRHSICALGPLATMLLDGHDACCPADGAGSPFDRLRALDRAWIITLGLPRAYISFLHWVEDVDPERFPMDVHAERPVEHQVRTTGGEVRTVRDLERRPEMTPRLDLPWIASHLSPSGMRHSSYKEIDIGVYPVKQLAGELLTLRDAGIVHYR